jgi:hypothetical protein
MWGKTMSVHFMSMSVDWATPKAVYDALDAEFHFTDDPCPLYGADGENGLEREWGGATFVNLPYGRAIGAWTAKALAESERGKTVVMLIPSRTDTIWWHRDIMKASEIRFLKGRLKFGDATNSAPFPSAVVVFRGERMSDETPKVVSELEWEGTTYVSSGFELGAWRLEECDDGVLLRRSITDAQTFFAPNFDAAKALAQRLESARHLGRP